MILRIKRIACGIFSFLLICLAIVYPVFGAEQTEYNSKLERNLLVQIEMMNGEERTDVAVWLKDIDHDAEKAQVTAALNEEINDGELVPEVIDMLMLGGKVLDEKLVEQIDEAVSVEQMQKSIQIKRRISASIYKSHNKQIIENLFTSGRITEENSFISTYAPLFVSSLSKNEILDICESHLVEGIYSCSSKTEECDGEAGSGSGLGAASGPYTSFQNDIPRITELRQQGYTGEGIKVGVCDSSFANPENVNYLSQINKLSSHYHCDSDRILDSYTAHGSQVACLIAGTYNNTSTGDSYLGAVPDAELYFAATSSFFGDVEYLISQNVNVINISMIVYQGSNIMYNTYTAVSKWIDHLVSQHNVNIVIGAGNAGSDGVPPGQYSYNTITVGSCDSDCVLSEYSSYSNVTAGMFKPDIVAPGTHIRTPAFIPNPNNPNSTTNSGTSYSTPIVTGAVAQLCEAKPTLATNPRMMKSAILAGAAICDNMTTSEMICFSGNTSYQGFSRPYGAGILNVINSRFANTYIMNHQNNTDYYYVDAYSNYFQNVHLQRFAVVWDVPVAFSNAHLNLSDINYALDPQTFNIGVWNDDDILVAEHVFSMDGKGIISFESNDWYVHRVFAERISGLENSTPIAVSYSVQQALN